MTFNLKHKFRAKRQELDGKKFPSKLEAKYYSWLKDKQTSGDLIFFLRQVPLDLPGNSRYVVDFVEFWQDTVVFTDCKGMETQIFKLKQRQIEEIYPIRLNIVKNGKFQTPMERAREEAMEHQRVNIEG